MVKADYRSAAVVAAVAALVYMSALGGSYQTADYELFVDRALVTRPDSLWSLLSQPMAFGPNSPLLGPAVWWRPGTMLSYRFGFWLHGNSVSGFEGFNVVLHALAAALVVLLSASVLRRYDLKGRAVDAGGWGVLAGLLFATHPLASQAVNLLSARSTLLATVGMLASLVLALRGRRWLSSGAFLLAVSCGPVALATPLVILLSEFFFVRPEHHETPVSHLGNVVWRQMPNAVILGAYVMAERVITAEVIVQKKWTAAETVLTWSKALWLHASLLFRPGALSFHHGLHVASSTGDTAAAGASSALLVLLVAVLALWFLWGQRAHVGVWTAILAVLVSVTTVGVAPWHLADESRAYPSLIFLCIGLVALVRAFYKPGRIAQAAAVAVSVVLISGLAWATGERNEVWESPDRVWEDATAKAPADFGTFFRAAVYDCDRNRHERCIERMLVAENHFEGARRSEVRGRICRAWMELKRPRKARDYCEKALKYDDQGDPVAHLYMGRILRDQDRDMRGARAHFGKAIELAPDLTEAWYDRGMVRLSTGQRDAAVKDFNEAIARDPTFAPAYLGLSEARQRIESTEAGIEPLEQLLKQHPEHPDGHDAMARLLMATGKAELAREHSEKARAFRKAAEKQAAQTEASSPESAPRAPDAPDDLDDDGEGHSGE